MKKYSPKYHVCMLCPEVKYITQHHIDGKEDMKSSVIPKKIEDVRTIPLCPKCHAAIHAGDLKFYPIDELWKAYMRWAKKGYPIAEKPFGNIWENKMEEKKDETNKD